MSAPTGLGIWIAFLGSAEGGDPDRIIAKCKQYGISWLAVKSGDTNRNAAWNVTGPRLVQKAHDAGMKIYTWNYSVPSTWRSQVLQIESCFKDGVDGHILDAEIEWQDTTKHVDAAAFVNALREQLAPDSWLSHAPFDCPTWHAAFPYKEFGLLDAVMPQCYWTEHNDLGANKNLDIVDSQWKTIQPQPPFMPIGVTYGKGTGWGKPPGTLTVADIRAFMARYPGTKSFYSMEAAMPAFWQALQQGPVLPNLTVLQAQQAMQKAGYSIAADGIMGPATQAALKDFQAKHGLVADGIIGPRTSDALRSI